MNPSVERHARQRPGNRSHDIDPYVVELHRHDRRSQGTSRVHRRPADRAGPQGLQPDHPADSDARQQFFLAGSRGDAENHDHEDQRQQKFENERLEIAPGGNRGAQRPAFRKQRSERATRQKSPGTLTDDVWHDTRRPKLPGCPETERDGRVDMASRDLPQGIDHRHHDQSERECHAHMRDTAPRHLVDDHRPGPGKHEAKRAERFGTETTREEGLVHHVP